MLPRMLMPGWLSLILLTLPQAFCVSAAKLNASQHFHQFRGATRTSKPPTTTMTSGGGQFFFADVNTKINAKVGTKAELPCLVYGIDLTNVVVSDTRSLFRLTCKCNPKLHGCDQVSTKTSLSFIHII